MKRAGTAARTAAFVATFVAAFFAALGSMRGDAQAPVVPALIPSSSAARFVVVLDAAHGGEDSGGHSGEWVEKSFTLELSVRLRSLLAARGIAVVTTRETDTMLAPERRIAIADHANAQACLSLHASLSGSGIHLFASSLAPVQPARFEPWRTAQAASVTRSLALAGVLNSALQHTGMTVTLGRTGLPVIDSLTCPAIAIEVSPENPANRPADQSPSDNLSNPDYQARVAEALAGALVEWRQDEQHLGAGQP
jgi:N-acetylmuramoyl-L-alanine amidase